MLADDFFARYSRCLFGPPSRTQPSFRANQRQVQIYCKVSELDESNGCKRLVRRNLTRVSEDEEGEEEEEEDYGEHESDEGTGGMGFARGARKVADLRDKGDFRMFLLNQAAGKSGRPRVRHIYQEKGRSKFRGSNEGSNPLKNGQLAKDPDKLTCYELFCIHQASLLVHRSQVFVEAERLANRLAQLAPEPLGEQVMESKRSRR